MTESVASPDGVGMGVGGVPFSLTPLFLLGGPQRSSCGLWAGLPCPMGPCLLTQWLCLHGGPRNLRGGVAPVL